MRFIGPEDQKTEAYRKLQPFGQVPVLETDGASIFESGAIVMHLAEQHEALMPKDAPGRDRVKSWMFAALSTVEPPISMLVAMDMHREIPAETLKPLRDTVVERIGGRLDDLTTFLGDRPYLVEGRFTAADLLMTSVLRVLRTTDLVTKRSTLDAYRLATKRGPR